MNYGKDDHPMTVQEEWKPEIDTEAGRRYAAAWQADVAERRRTERGPRDYYWDSAARYHGDAEFHAAVDVMQNLAMAHGFTPGELRQIAFYAALLIEERTFVKRVYGP